MHCLQRSAAALLAGLILLAAAAEAREMVVLESSRVRVSMDLGGGAIGEFRFGDGGVNPLSWAAPAAGDEAVRGYGHFLCLDRWGPPSEAEGQRGMPYHGEASNVRWTLEQAPGEADGAIEARASARLPKAGLAVRRTIRLSTGEAVFSVHEEVTNENALGRVFNIVQHPTIAPPFLDEGTVVDCNGGRGFAQGGSLPSPEEPSAAWPSALKKNGEQVNLRGLKDDPDPNVVSFELTGSIGWITAVNAKKGLLIGYAWPVKDYPWVSVWRDVRDGKPAARGLEFGSTGLHQPFPVLVKKGKIWDRPLVEYIDAGQTITKSYVAFLLKVPAEVDGVRKISRDGDRLIVNAGQHEFAVSLRGVSIF